MKKLLLTALAAAGLLALGSCTSHFFASGSPGKLIVNTGGGSSGRAITGSTDIQSATITIDDITDASPVTVLSEPFDWTNTETGYNVPVGRTYRIRLEIVPTAAAPGAKTGVLRYGDEDVVTLAEDEYTFVFLNVRPSRTYAFHHRVANGPKANAWTGAAAQSTDLSGFNQTADDRDRIFYGPDGALYFFSKNANQISRWADYSQPLNLTNAGTKVIDGATLGDLPPFSIDAVTVDSDIPDLFWLAGTDSDGQVHVLGVYADPEGPAAVGTVAVDSGALEAQFEGPFALGLYELVVTGIAQDWVGGLYLSYYATGTDGGENYIISSGVVQLDPFSGAIVASYPANPVLTDATGGIVRDVTYQSGRVIAAVGPVLGEFSGLDGQGTADLWVFLPGLAPGGEIPSPLAQTFTGNVVGGQSNGLYRPRAFASGLYKSQIYLEQRDGTGYSDLTRLDLAGGTAVFVHHQSTYHAP